MSDAVLGATALAVLLAAWRAAPVPVWLALGGCLAAWRCREPLVWAVALALLAGALSARAWRAVAPTVPGTAAGWFDVRDDPTALPGVVSFVAVEQDGDGRRLDVWVSGGDRGTANELQAGDSVWIAGAVEPRPSGADWLARRHVVGRLAAQQLGDIRYASGLAGAANRLRRLLGIGAQSLGPNERSLFAGFVLGDDRDQSPVLADTFRAAGLSHLLVVSGQNVAFVLLLARPLLRRLSVRARFAGSVTVLWFFAMATRFEPSVLRATVMAAVASAAWTLALPLSTRRVLASSVILLVLLDPLIAGSLGFLLSVAATAGITLLARPIAGRVKGPRWWREAVGVTIAAQLAVAPILAPLGDGLPIASLPANVVAVPVAGPLMAWGLTAGSIAGLAAEAGHIQMAAVLHLPTRVMVWWVGGVAEHAAGAPSGRIGIGALMGAALLIGLALRSARRVPRLVLVLAALAALAPGALPAGPATHGKVTVGGASAWAGTDPGGRPVQVVTVSGRTRVEDILTLARRVPLTDVVVVSTSPSSAARAAIGALSGRARVHAAYGPRGFGPGPTPALAVTEVVGADADLDVGGLRVRVVPVGTRLEVWVTERAGSGGGDTGVASARGPPHRRADHRASRTGVAAGAVARRPGLRHHPSRGRDGDPQPHAGLLL